MAANIAATPILPRVRYVPHKMASLGESSPRTIDGPASGMGARGSPDVRATTFLTRGAKPPRREPCALGCRARRSSSCQRTKKSRFRGGGRRSTSSRLATTSRVVGQARTKTRQSKIHFLSLFDLSLRMDGAPLAPSSSCTLKPLAVPAPPSILFFLARSLPPVVYTHCRAHARTAARGWPGSPARVKGGNQRQASRWRGTCIVSLSIPPGRTGRCPRGGGGNGGSDIGGVGSRSRLHKGQRVVAGGRRKVRDGRGRERGWERKGRVRRRLAGRQAGRPAGRVVARGRGGEAFPYFKNDSEVPR